MIRKKTGITLLNSKHAKRLNRFQIIKMKMIFWWYRIMGKAIKEHWHHIPYKKKSF
jgi:hypothetical protein